LGEESGFMKGTSSGCSHSCPRAFRSAGGDEDCVVIVLRLPCQSRGRRKRVLTSAKGERGLAWNLVVRLGYPEQLSQEKKGKEDLQEEGRTACHF